MKPEATYRVMKGISKEMRLSAKNARERKPKYVVLFSCMLRAFEQGKWRPGDRLPSEKSLAAALPASLGTIQKALRALTDEGVIVRRRGHGTIVQGTLTDSRQIRNCRFLADDGKSVLPVYSKALSVKRSTSSGPWSDLFPGERSFVRICRHMSVNAEFKAYGEAYLPESRFREFLNVPLESLDGLALTYTLAERFDARAVKITSRLRCAELPPIACRHIGVPVDSVGMEWELLGWSFRDLPIFYQRFYLPPTHRKLEILVGPPSANSVSDRQLSELIAASTT